MREAGLVFCLAIVFLLFRGEQTTFINADGMGYYEYLPSAFIHKDFIRKDLPVDVHPEAYKRLNTLYVYIKDGDKLLDKYSCGTALLMMPFFMGANFFCYMKGIPVSGYEKPFQVGILLASFFYLFLSLVLLRRWMSMLGINHASIGIIQLLLVFASPVAHYATTDAAFSHVYSLFACQLFVFATISFALKKNPSYVILSGIALGLVMLLRPVNILVVAFVPFLMGSFRSCINLFSGLIKNRIYFISAVLLAAGIFCLHPLAVWLQTGNWRINTYLYESFRFNDPHLIDVLFSFRKGLFVYTPVLAISVASLLHLFVKRRLFEALLFLCAFSLLTYVTASWWNWQYGCSFGQRVYIEYLGFLLLPLAFLINEVGFISRITVLIPCLLCIPVNLIQAYQYKNYILHWDQMDFDKYKKVFLKTGEAYRGILWHPYIPAGTVTLGADSLKEFAIKSPSSSLDIHPANPAAVDSANLLTVSFRYDGLHADKIKLCLLVIEKHTEKKLSVIETFLNHFEPDESGLYRQRFSCSTAHHSGEIYLKLASYSTTESTLRDISISYLRSPFP